MVHFIDEENFVTYVDFHSDITFYPEAPTKVGQINRERKNNFRSCQRPKCIPSDVVNSCSIDEERTSNIFMSLHILWDMDPAAPVSLNHNAKRESMSSKYPQKTTDPP